MLCITVSTPLMAQTTAAQDIIQTEKPVVSSSTNISGFAVDFLNDQKAIWTSPLHLKAGDAKFLAPAAVGVGTLLVFDHKISNSVKNDTSLRSPSNAISNIGLIAPYAVPGTMWFLGAAKHDAHAAEAGRLGLEAQLDSEVVMNVIKIAVGRGRPNGEDHRSFPSGHTMSAFAMAAVMSREYHDKPLVVFGSYGFATAVGLARVGGLNHFPSDVLAGAVIGELIGRYVVHHHAQLADQ
jgi:membrane-associated phospholipid phosphatase